MNKKSFIIVGSILAILIIVAVGIGLSKRETHDDPFKDSKYGVLLFLKLCWKRYIY